MSSDVVREDPLLVALRELPARDLSPARAARLRARCHSALRAHNVASQVPLSRQGERWRRGVRLFAGAWCIVYLFETIRRAAAVYGF